MLGVEVSQYASFPPHLFKTCMVTHLVCIPSLHFLPDPANRRAPVGGRK